MPDTQNPEYSEGSDHGFKPSVPDLRPNLGEYQTVGTGNADQGLATHFENNDVGRDASELYALNEQNVARAKIAGHERTRIQGEAEEAGVGINALREALRHTSDSAEKLMERAILTEAIKILEKRQVSLQERVVERAEAADDYELEAAKAEIMARNHYHGNEEAYKNQAVNDARRAGVDVNYPPYTDQEPQTSPGYTGLEPEKTGGIYMSPNLEGNMAGQVAQELRDRVTDGDESARAEAAAHYYANEEAYRNQAIMDADRAGVDIDTGQIKTTSDGNHKKVEMRNTIISGSIIGNDMRGGKE